MSAANSYNMTDAAPQVAAQRVGVHAERTTVEPAVAASPFSATSESEK